MVDSVEHTWLAPYTGAVTPLRRPRRALEHHHAARGPAGRFPVVAGPARLPLRRGLPPLRHQPHHRLQVAEPRLVRDAPAPGRSLAPPQDLPAPDAPGRRGRDPARP